MSGENIQRLLDWCRKRTEKYKGVEIEDFNASWKSGLAFCALLDSFQPQLIQFNSLGRNDESNLKKAFEVAEGLGIPKLLETDPSSFDEASIIAYLTSLYQTLDQSNSSSDSIKSESRQAKGDTYLLFPLQIDWY